MEVILKEDVPKLGLAGDVINVADGYGRNYLLPQKLAIEATPSNRSVIVQMKAAAERRAAREKGSAEQLAQQLETVSLSFRRRSGENDQLFGSVTSADIAKALEGKGFTVDRRKITLDEPLKHLGEFSVPIRLHREVTAHIQVAVLKDAEQEAAEAAAAEATAAEAARAPAAAAEAETEA